MKNIDGLDLRYFANIDRIRIVFHQLKVNGSTCDSVIIDGPGFSIVRSNPRKHFLSDEALKR